MTTDRRAKYDRHPLDSLAGARGMHPRELMNALQEGPVLLISDNCVRTTDVAECDVDMVLLRAGGWMLKRGLEKPKTHGAR